MVGQLAAGLIVLLINWQFSGFISLSRSAVLHGQIWRLITFCSSRCGWAARWAS